MLLEDTLKCSSTFNWRNFISLWKDTQTRFSNNFLIFTLDPLNKTFSFLNCPIYSHFLHLIFDFSIINFPLRLSKESSTWLYFSRKLSLELRPCTCPLWYSFEKLGFLSTLHSNFVVNRLTFEWSWRMNIFNIVVVRLRVDICFGVGV